MINVDTRKAGQPLSVASLLWLTLVQVVAQTRHPAPPTKILDSLSDEPQCGHWEKDFQVNSTQIGNIIEVHSISASAV